MKRVLHPAHLLLIPLHVLICSTVMGVPQPEPSNPLPRVVMIVAQTQQERLSEIVAAVESQLSDLNVQLQVLTVETISTDLGAAVRSAEAREETTGAAVVFWWDIQTSRDVYLFISEGDQRRILVRRLDPMEVDTGYEALAVIVRSVIDAVLKGGRIGVEVASLESRPPPAVRMPPAKTGPIGPPDPRVRLRIKMGYDLRTFSAKHPVVQGFALGLGLAFKTGFQLMVGTIFREPVTLGGEGNEVQLRSHPMLIAAGFGRDLGRVNLGGSLSVMGDILNQETLRVPGETTMPSKNTDFLLSLAPSLSANIALLRSLCLFFDVGFQWDLTSVEYVTRIDNIDRKIDAPWRVRFTAAAGLAFSF